MSTVLERLKARPKGSPRSPEEIDIEATEALRLKLEGWTDTEIGDELGLVRQTVARRIDYAVETLGARNVEVYRQIALQRYEKLIHAALDRATDDNYLDVIKVVGDLNAKFAKLVGAEAPVQVDMQVTQVTEQEKALRDMLAQAERDEKVRETVIVEGEVVADA